MSTTLKEKVAEAASYIVNTDDTTTFNSEQFVWKCLNDLGIYDDEMSLEILTECREGDARAVFCEKHNQPVPRFRKVWNILKEGESEEATSSNNLAGLEAVVQSVKPIGQFSNKDLLIRYSENMEDSVAEEELKKRSKGGNCIVFEGKEKINVTLSNQLLQKAARGLKVPKIYKADGKVLRVFPVGVFPQETYDVCPVTGEILFEGYSEGLGVSWEIPLEVRQFVWLMDDQGIKIDAFTADNIQETFKKDGFDALKAKFVKITELYEELAELGDLPSLKAKLDSKSTVSDPFGKRKTSKRY
jgi:hypothetical protein